MRKVRKQGPAVTAGCTPRPAGGEPGGAARRRAPAAEHLVVEWGEGEGGDSAVGTIRVTYTRRQREITPLTTGKRRLGGHRVHTGGDLGQGRPSQQFPR